MIVVAIIGILAAVAIPKFADLVTKSKESTAKGVLGSLRSAISVYYSDNTFYPDDVEIALTAGQKYFASIPIFSIPVVAAQGNPGHLLVTGVKNVAVADDDVATGVFAYDNGVTGGTLLVNCIHRDTKGTLWSSY